MLDAGCWINRNLGVQLNLNVKIAKVKLKVYFVLPLFYAVFVLRL